ncbi:MAG TPA: hypothetical protein VFI53_14610, partial [Myxococcaceae bacterium]|nr:hypothetical protein [Myxococcaceae bacterium]
MPDTFDVPPTAQRSWALALLAGVLVLAPAAAYAQAPAAPAPVAADAGVERAIEPLSVDRQVIPEAVRLGDPFVYRITVHHPPGQRWELRTP